MKTYSAAITGVTAFVVEHTTTTLQGSAFVITDAGHGDCEARCRESRVRIRASLRSIGLDTAGVRVQLSDAAPAGDLASAVGVLAHQGVVPTEAGHTMYLGSLDLEGSLRPVRGVLPMLIAARTAGIRSAIVPRAQADEAALALVAAPDMDVRLADRLANVSAYLQGDTGVLDAPHAAVADPESGIDMTDVIGHAGPKRALLVAAAGGHHILLCGPPGSGRTMIARRVTTILPDLTRAEELAVASVASAAGIFATPLRRPFRVPHHTVSEVGLVGGGGTGLWPGEVTLADGGVLMLDEVPEMRTSTLQAAMAAMASRHVTIHRRGSTTTMPAGGLLVACTQLCPCGYRGAAGRKCKCEAARVEDYQRRWQPLRGVVQMRVDVGEAGEPEERPISSASYRRKVDAARAKQLARQGCLNSLLEQEALDKVAPLDPGAESIAHAYRASTSTMQRIARTIADLAGNQAIMMPQWYEAGGLAFGG